MKAWSTYARYLIGSAFILGLALFSVPGDTVSATHYTEPGDNVPWNDTQVTSADSLLKTIMDGKKPTVLQVGVEFLYKTSHVPGSKFAGPAQSDKGVEKLKAVAEKLPRDEEVIIYCGCCPMKDCPNVKPAFTVLEKMGFKKVKVLNLPNDFIADWINKGYPAEKGE